MSSEIRCWLGAGALIVGSLALCAPAAAQRRADEPPPVTVLLEGAVFTATGAGGVGQRVSGIGAAELRVRVAGVELGARVPWALTRFAGGNVTTGTVGAPSLSVAWSRELGELRLSVGGGMIVPMPSRDGAPTARIVLATARAMSGQRDFWAYVQDHGGAYARAAFHSLGAVHIGAELSVSALVLSFADTYGGASAQLDMVGGYRFGPLEVAMRASIVALADFAPCRTLLDYCEWGDVLQPSFTPFVRFESRHFDTMLWLLMNLDGENGSWFDVGATWALGTQLVARF